MISKEVIAKYIKLMREYMDQDMVTKQEFISGYLKAFADLENVFLSPIDEKPSLCEYYRKQDGRCRATRECEWEGCNGNRSKCPHNKMLVL